jgi:hypothetical protein
MIMHDDKLMICKKVVVTCFKVQPQHYLGKAKIIHQKFLIRIASGQGEDHTRQAPPQKYKFGDLSLQQPYSLSQ